jgi:glycosyltransferase involved in cell wall biosynthesis
MKVLIFGDGATETGFGRICDSIGVRAFKRGHQVLGAGLYFDGLLPPQFEGQPLPYHVAALASKPDPYGEVAKLIGVFQPDVVLCVQDYPYAVQLFQHPGIDWSRHARVMITPVDGVPIEPTWLDLLPHLDGAMTISEFGVKAFADAGYRVGLCRPGINPDKFFRIAPDQRREVRAKLGLTDGHFLLGTMAQNQGRKCISIMVEAFMAWAKDKPHARYLLDMDEVSPAGWHIPNMVRANGWDATKLIFRSDAIRAGITDLRDRYNALDAHVVLAHREGYGLPLVEAMACGVVSMAMDYCSGTEIVGDGRGCLVKPIDYSVIGTWGGARDYFPDKADFIGQLQWLHDHPAERAAMAERGMAWAREQTWDKAADATIAVLEAANARRKAWLAAQPVPAPEPPPAVLSPVIARPDAKGPGTDGVSVPVELVEGAA